MSGFLVDTNALSEVRKPRPNRAALSFIRGIEREALFTSVLVLAEIRKGIEQLADSRKRRDLEHWLMTDLTPFFGDRALAVEHETADRWGRIEAATRRTGIQLRVVDALIAATALTYGLSIITRNEKDFLAIGAPTINPWAAE